MITVTIDPRQIAAMKAAIENTGRRLRKELAIACNQTANKGKSLIAKQISKELAIPQKTIKLAITTGRKANEVNIKTSVDVKKDGRINLGYFGGRQTKKGVSYKVSKSKGRSVIQGAFVIKKYDGKVYKRNGKARFPLQGMYGPSPWGVFVVGKKIEPSTQEIEAELKKNIDRRIRFIKLKASGEI